MIKRSISLSLAICLVAYPLVYVQAATLAAEQRNTPGPLPVAAALSAEQIDNLLAPIALYPDPLIAQMLPASTFVDQIDQAARYLRANNNQTTGVDNQNWDVSVKSIAHYPQVVFSMSDKLDWTTALGQAYVTQATDVFNSIQRLRDKAKDYGYLKTTPQQTVIVEKEIIKIVPAQPQYIYVPTYNPQVVYVPVPSSGPSPAAVGAIAFTTGLLIGAWLNNDCNWYSHSVYYHGWRGVGWVSSSATVVRVNNSVYVNARYSTVHYNTAVVNRNVNYNNVNVYNNVNRNVNYNNVNVNNVNVNNVNRNNVNVNNVNVNNANVNNVNRNTANVNNASVNNYNKNQVSNQNLNKNVNSSNANSGAYRGNAGGASTQQRPTAQQSTQSRASAWGGGNASQTRAQSTRGQASRTAPAASAKPTSTSRSSGGAKAAPSSGGRRKN